MSVEPNVRVVAEEEENEEEYDEDYDEVHPC